MQSSRRLLGVVLFYAFSCCFMFALGHHLGHTKTATAYEKKITALKTDWQSKADAVEKEAQEKYEEQSKKLSAALAARDKALSDARNLRINAQRVRDIADTRASADLQAAAAAGDSNKERLGRCEKLLGEGAELAGEGAELSARVSADKDALASQL